VKQYFDISAEQVSVRSSASPARFAFISDEQLNVIRKLFVKAHRCDLTENLYSADELFAKRDQQLIKATCCKSLP